MKKRYARILAATLSAAMVFTSAPASVFDTGVIEAEAATTVTMADVTASLPGAEQVIRVPYKAGTVKADIESAMNALGNAYLDFTYVNGSGAGADGDAIDAATIASHATTPVAIKYTAAIKGTVTVSDGSWNGATERDVKIQFVKKTVTEDDLSVPTGITSTYKSGTVSGLGSWTLVEGEDAKLKADGVKAGDKVNVSIQLIKGDGGVVDYTGIAEKTEVNPGTYKFVRTIEVEITAAATGVASAYPQVFTAANIPEYAYMEYGDSEATINYSSDAATKAEQKKWTIKETVDLTKLPVNTAAIFAEDHDKTTATVINAYNLNGSKDLTVDVKGASATAITLQTEAPDADNYSDKTTSLPAGVTYNSATKCYEKKIPVVVLKKSVDISKIVWPKNLAADNKIEVGKAVNTLDLEETATSKYGTFRLSGVVPSKAGDVTYDVKFTPNANTKVIGTAYGTITATTGVVTNPGAFKYTVGKDIIKDSDIVVELDPAYDATALTYGVTYGDIYDEIPQSVKMTNNGSLKLKDVTSGQKLSVGDNTITLVYELFNPDKTQFADGTTKKEFTVKATVKKPELKLDIQSNTYNNANPNETTVSTVKNTVKTLYAGINMRETDATAATNTAAYTDVVTNGIAGGTVKYQWYENGVAIKGADESTYTPSVKAIEVTKYSCTASFELKSGASATEKKYFENLIGGTSATVSSEEVVFCVTNMAGTLRAASDVAYGYEKAVLKAQLSTVPAGYTIDSVKASYKNADGDTVAIADSALTMNDNKREVSVALPTGLSAATYPVYVTFVAHSKDVSEDVITLTANQLVDKAVLPNTKWNKVKLTTESIVYGTKTKEIKFTTPEGSEEYGKYSWESGDSCLAAGTHNGVKVVFIPNKKTKDNYYDNTQGTPFVVKTISVDDVKIEKASLAIKPADVIVNIGEDLPTPTLSATGLVNGDTLANLNITADFTYDDTVSTKSANTFKGAVKAKVSVINLTNGTVTEVKAGNKDAILGNYKIAIEDGDVIVKAKGVAPSVKPTPAPVKQAVAAKAKAVKSKATVKVGKKYTLKLKYAAGKKSTVKKVKWTSSKKSVATVSSKGKVTAKKAGKATIYARVYFKDGSMKKIKFTVTVK